MEESTPLTAETLVYAYASGVFPMAEETGEIFWYSPDPRAIIPIQSYKPAKSLKPIINQKRFEIRVDTCFEQVMRNCALPRPTENETWISEEMIAAYTELHRMGLAHSVEAWQDGKLVGGLYGVALGAAFFGEVQLHHALVGAAAGAGARLEEQVGHRAAPQALVARRQFARKAHVELREVEQVHDLVARESFEGEQVTQTAGGVALQLSAGVGLGHFVIQVASIRRAAFASMSSGRMRPVARQSRVCSATTPSTGRPS